MCDCQIRGNKSCISASGDTTKVFKLAKMLTQKKPIGF